MLHLSALRSASVSRTPKMRKSSGKIVGVPFLGIGDHTVKVKRGRIGSA